MSDDKTIDAVLRYDQDSKRKLEILEPLAVYDIIDTAREEAFDAIVKMAAITCRTPMALVTFFDGDRQWFKAHIGIKDTEITTRDSICFRAASDDDVFVVPDTQLDTRFATIACVQAETPVRFYAGAILRDASGEIVGSVCVLDTVPRIIGDQERFVLKALAGQVRDLLELRRTQKDKKALQERLRFAVNTATTIGTWEWDIKSNLVRADNRLAELFALDPALVETGVPIPEFIASIHPDDSERVAEKIKAAVECEGEFAEEYRVVNKEGVVRWIFANGRSYNDRNGQPLRFPGAVVDITEKKRFERKRAALVELSDRFTDIHDTAEITGVAAEILGNTLGGTRAGYGKIDETGHFIVIEKDWTNSVDVSLAGVHYFREYGEEFAKSIRNGDVIVINDVREDPRTASAAENFEHANIRSLINVTLRENGRSSALCYIHDSVPRAWRPGEIQLLQDIAQRTWAMAERAHAEEQMQEALDKAEKANIAKTEFLANMSHEIRTPMNAIVGLSSILSQEQLTPRQQEFIRTLQMSADSLLELINDLLDISKIEARTVELEAISFDIKQMMQDIYSMMSVKAQQKALDLRLDMERLESCDFIGDPMRLRQIILNLCSNAIKFTSTGSVHIQLESQSIAEEPSLQQLYIRVEDTGIGIPADKLDLIFEKFIQGDNSISRQYGGTGLGLAITKRLVELMSGFIQVESEVNKGTVFTVALPMSISPRHEPSDRVAVNTAMRAQAIHHAAKRVLLVEDYAPNILVAGTFLEEFGYEWDSAKNGIEAVEKVTNGHYDVVLMDVQMSGMNGLEATAAIRVFEQDNQRRRIPIIGMTAHALEGDREKCLTIGMDDYIAKPFSPDELKDKLDLMTRKTN